MQNSRLNTRAPFFSEVNVLRMGEKSTRRVWGKNISESGMYLQTTHSYEQGERLSLRFMVGAKEVLVRAAEVIWTKRFEPVAIDGVLPGVALRFLSVDPPARMAIRSYVHEGLMADATSPIEFSKPSLPHRVFTPQVTDKLPEPQTIRPLPARDERLSLLPKNRSILSNFPTPSPVTFDHELEETRPQLPRSAQLSETKPYPVKAESLIKSTQPVDPAFAGWRFELMPKETPTLEQTLADAETKMASFLDETLDETTPNDRPRPKREALMDTIKTDVPAPPELSTASLLNAATVEVATPFSDPISSERVRNSLPPEFSLEDFDVSELPTQPPRGHESLVPKLADSSVSDLFFQTQEGLKSIRDESNLDLSMPKEQFNVPDFLANKSPADVVEEIQKERPAEDSFVEAQHAAFGSPKRKKMFVQVAAGACLFLGAASIAYFSSGSAPAPAPKVASAEIPQAPKSVDEVEKRTVKKVDAVVAKAKAPATQAPIVAKKEEVQASKREDAPKQIAADDTPVLANAIKVAAPTPAATKAVQPAPKAKAKAVSPKGQLKVRYPTAGTDAKVVRAFGLANPSRVVVDLEDAPLPKKRNFDLDQPGLKRVRMGTPGKGRSRVVIELDRAAAPRQVQGSVENGEVVVRWK